MARIVGLTGGIASGKSTVARILRELGARIVDADQLARDVVEPGTPALAEIVARFGADVVDDAGRLDRKKLGAIVFDDPDARRDLERITHPRIGAAAAQATAAHVAGGAEVVVYEAALIVENRLHRGMNALIVVAAPRELQVSRIMQRDGVDRAAAEARIAAQLPLADKVAVADYVVHNDGDLAATRAQVEDIWSQITRTSSSSS